MNSIKKSTIFSYLSLLSVSVIGDAVFLYFVVLSALNLPHGGLLSGIFFSMDAAIRVGFMPLSAKLIDKITYSKRWVISLITTSLAIPAAILPGIYPPRTTSDYVWLIPLILFLSCLNRLSEQARLECVFRLSGLKVIKLTQYSSFMNLSIRGANFFAPIIAVYFLNKGWLIAAILNSTTFISAFLASIIGYKYFRNLSSDNSTEENIEKNKLVNKLVKWNNALLFSTNLALGGIILILTTFVKTDTLSFFYLNPVSALYLGFIFTLIVVIIFPRMVYFINSANTNTVLWLLSITCLLFGLSSLINSNIIIFTLIITGISYALTLNSFFPAIWAHFKGSRLTRHVSQSQASGKIGTIISSLIIGTLIDMDYRPKWLLLTASLTGLFFVILMAAIKKRVRISF